jgi:hypothetical protein
MIEKDFLEHWGIKGMKWGRRKARATGPGTGHRPKAPIKAPIKVQKRDDDHDAEKPKKSPTKPHEMDDVQLRNAINRIQMEKQYAQLTAREKSLGRKFAEDVLLGAGKQVATQYAAKYMGQGVEALLKKK